MLLENASVEKKYSVKKCMKKYVANCKKRYFSKMLITNLATSRENRNVFA